MPALVNDVNRSPRAFTWGHAQGHRSGYASPCAFFSKGGLAHLWRLLCPSNRVSGLENQQ